MTSDSNDLQSIIDRLQGRGLMPPVKSLEAGEGGWLRVTVLGSVDEDLHARLSAAMGSARWKLVQAHDASDAGVAHHCHDRPSH